MNSKLIKQLVAGLLMTAALPALAHHSFYAEFDSNKTVKLEGTVVKMQWVNPHSWLTINIKNAEGKDEEWQVEGGSPGVLLRLGWTKDSLPPGTKVIVNGFMAKDGSHRANSRSIEFPDGRKLETGSSAGPDKK
jgi:hypothetical protein